MQRSQQTEDAFMALASATSVQEALKEAYMARLLNGTGASQEAARANYISAGEAVADRIRDLIWHQMIDQQIDPSRRIRT